jgi:phosphoesterase RecJ-like protein
MNADRLNDLAALDLWIKKVSSVGAVPILCGENGDMDTVGSAIALAAAIPNGMACGLHRDKVAKRVTEILEAPFRYLDKKRPELPRKLGGVICVDAASPGQVGIEIPDGIPICIIDHHATSDWELGKEDLELRWGTRATTQIIFEYLQQYCPSALTNPVRKLLLAGLITDTGRFRHADGEALFAGSQIIGDSEIDYASFVELIEKDDLTDSDRGALAAGLSRVKNSTAGSWQLMHTNVSTSEARMCKVLLVAGAEVALVSRHREGITRLSARATRNATLRGVHLGEIMAGLAEKLGGDGGGHDGAAGWSGEADRVAVESAFIHSLSGIVRAE